MAMNDEETVALIAGGHTFGKTHGAGPATHVGPEPEGGNLEEQGFGWKGGYETGGGAHAITSGLEVTWTTTPTRWGNDFFTHLFEYQWELTTSPAGAKQWKPKDDAVKAPSRTARPVKEDCAGDADDRPRAAVDPHTRRSRGVSTRTLRSLPTRFQSVVQVHAPRHGTDFSLPRPPRAEGTAVMAGPCPAGRSRVDRRKGHRGAQKQDPRSGIVGPQLVSTAWASASSFRGTDKRGGANGARVRLAPQKDWEVNDPPELAKVLKTLEKIQKEFNEAQNGPSTRDARSGQASRKKVSLADLIVLSGCAAIEKAAKDGGYEVQVPFTPGRTDASQEQTDIESFAILEPDADGFRNYVGPGHQVPAEHLLIERAFRLTLSAPEMTVLVGGLRVLKANAGQSDYGVFTKRPGTLTNDFFVNLLDMGTEWKPTSDAADVFEGRCPYQGDTRWTASRVDLVFGSHSELRAFSEVYACEDSREKFVTDFVAAWNKVMNLDRFDVA